MMGQYPYLLVCMKPQGWERASPTLGHQKLILMLLSLAESSCPSCEPQQGWGAQV